MNETERSEELNAGQCSKFMPVQSSWDASRFERLQGSAIPWSMIEPHNATAKANHGGQDLEQLARRGGVSACEALAILDDRPWVEMEVGYAHAELNRRLNNYY